MKGYGLHNDESAFTGVRILNLGWIVAAPWSCKYLADHGAEVINVETKSHPDMLRTAPPYKDGKPGLDNAPYFVQYHNNEYGLSINLKHPKGLEIIKRLISSWADVVIENFSPGIMKKWGLDYETIKKINAEIIMLSSSQMGQTGPQATQSGTGIQMTALAGFSNITGWPDRAPSLPYGAYTDCPAARFGAIALIAALDFRNRSGHGQYIDISQYETSIHLLGPTILDFNVNQRLAYRKGNRSDRAVPHNVYPCKDDNSWCAIAVYTDNEWHNFCEATENRPWLEDKRFHTFMSRKKHEDELDLLVSQWTAKYGAEQVMTQLQSAGVPAGIVKNCKELSKDPQLQFREYFWEVDHPVIGKHLLDAEAFQLPKSPRKLRMPAPTIGQHNEFICKEILKMSDGEFQKLLNNGVFE